MCVLGDVVISICTHEYEVNCLRKALGESFLFLRHTCMADTCVHVEFNVYIHINSLLEICVGLE